MRKCLADPVYSDRKHVKKWDNQGYTDSQTATIDNAWAERTV